MPNQIDGIMQTLGASPVLTGKPPSMSGYDQGQALTSSEGLQFRDWLRSIGVNETALDPQARLMYFEMWKTFQEMAKGQGQQGMQVPPGMRGGG